MTKVIEILFRNKGKLLALLLLPILVSGVVVFFLPRTYQATARLWALHRYAVISATGIESDMQSTEAMTQATALNEFLQTKSFDLAVAKDTDLAKHMGIPQSDTQDLQDALYAEISTHVVVTPSSQYLFVNYLLKRRSLGGYAGGKGGYNKLRQGKRRICHLRGRATAEQLSGSVKQSRNSRRIAPRRKRRTITRRTI